MPEIADWIKEIRKGDILRAKSGVLRVVRGVRHRRNCTYVSMTIMHCSWTKRCYTVLSRGDLTARFEPTPYRLKLNREIDAKIELELGGRNKDEIELHCCDVEGIR